MSIKIPSQIPLIKNKLRGLNSNIGSYQTEHERLGIEPIKNPNLDINKNVPKNTQTNTFKKIPNLNEQPIKSVNKTVVRGIKLPSQTKISIGTHTDQMWASLDGEDFNGESDENHIDNNEDVDIETIQNINVVEKDETEEFEENNQEIEPNIGEYMVLFCGKIVGSKLTFNEAENLIENIFFEGSEKDCLIENFVVFKRIPIKIGVHIG